MWTNTGISITPYRLGIPFSGDSVLVCTVQAFDGICGVNNLPDISRKFEDRREDIPVLLPAFHSIRIFLVPSLLDPLQIIRGVL